MLNQHRSRVLERLEGVATHALEALYDVAVVTPFAVGMWAGKCESGDWRIVVLVDSVLQGVCVEVVW